MAATSKASKPELESLFVLSLTAVLKLLIAPLISMLKLPASL
jgi:hypothetical protein